MADINEVDVLENDTSSSPSIRIEEGKVRVAESYAACRLSAKNLKDEYKAYCQTAKKAQSSPKAYSARLASAQRRYNAASAEYDKALSEYNKNIDAVLDEYRLLFAEGGKLAKKAKREAEGYVEAQDRLLDKLAAFVSETTLDADDESLDEIEEKETAVTVPEENKRTAARPQQNPYYYVPVPQPQINVAPVNIDITPMVEDAVSVALEKFSESFDARAKEYIDSVLESISIVPQGVKSSANLTPVSSLTVGIAENSAEDQAYITEKLTGVAEGVNELLTSVSELSIAYVELSQRQKEAVALQKQINDTHRALTREIEGLQVNQRVIAQEQATIAEEQTVVIEQQKAAAAKQKLIIEQQESIAELQRTAIDTQRVLENAVKEILTAQKELISTHHSLINGTGKIREQQTDLLAKQAELTELQRSAISEQKILLKAQKSFNEKIQARATKLSPVSKKEAVPTVPETPLEIAEEA